MTTTMPTPNRSALQPYDVDAVKADFPIFGQLIHGKPLIYLDNGATTHKPQSVIDRISNFYANEYGTVRRGVYALSEGSTDAFNQVRQQCKNFLHAEIADEIIFVRGSTEAINLVAHSYGLPHVGKDDEVIISAMEHHANIVPWQQLCLRVGAKLRVIPMDQDGVLDLVHFETMLNDRTKLVAVNHVSNALGTINPVKAMAQLAHKNGTPILVDGAQGAPHMRVDVQDLDCDFYCFSGHKLYGPTGVGVLYAKHTWQEKMIPYQCGGDMIDMVTFERTTFASPPNKFEAGTPAIAQVIGLGAALDYVNAIGINAIAAHEEHLLQVATERMTTEIDGLRIIGTAPHKASLISFVVDGAHPLDIGTLLDREGVAIRTGHHCAQPVMQHFGVPATARTSFGIYNTLDDIDAFVMAINKVLGLLR